MNKKIRQILLIIFIAYLVLFNKSIMPTRREISDLSLVKVVGLDIINEGIYKVQHTNVRSDVANPSTPSTTSSASNSSTAGGSSSSSSDSGSGSPSSSDSEEKNYKLFSVKAATFADAVRSFQTYTDKNLTGSHVLFFLLGEDFAKTGVNLGIDFNTRDYEVRATSTIYITKGTSAYDFLYEATKGTFDVDAKLKSMEENLDAKSISYKTTMLDVEKMIFGCDGTGLIPAIQIINNEEIKNQQKENPAKSNSIIDKQTAISVSDDVFFDYFGYAIIKDKKLAGYLDKEESLTSNILMNKAKGFNINIYLNGDDRVVTGITTSTTKYDFTLSKEGNIEEIKIKTSFRCNVEEVYMENYKFDESFINELQDKQDEQIKVRIEDIINKLKDYDADFLKIRDIFRSAHPYIYRNIEDKWMEQVKNAKISVDVESIIRRTYDFNAVDQEER